ncbi:uncharacterized protein LOC120115363 isoform X1 [Hibiscus syriacus]|uniref:uncharacterized protein LOC120115363 isoform X1 n=1 Tax=Hibiscus syriacus TaxID=106335 RepID=UPI00192319E3|nr:uncharacterized protein LOC120115363 isoform X1 [Hibiscus syriacus]
MRKQVAMASYLLVNGLRALFFVLCCLMIATLIYTIFIDGLPFRWEILTPWMAATLVDFYINIVPIAVWVSYKESSLITATLWVIMLICFGSITTSGYIIIQFLKLSPEESLENPIYHVLLHEMSKNDTKTKGKHSSVVIARILFSVLGCLMLGTLIYTLLTDGSPFGKELLAPWMKATLIDFYINVVALSVWVAYKESNSMTAICWIVLLICFGSITTCAYIVKELFKLAWQDPLYLVLIAEDDRAENTYESI